MAIVTAYCGPIVFLGLAVPHLCRALFRTSDHRILMPSSLLVGAAMALLCNLIARMPGFEGCFAGQLRHSFGRCTGGSVGVCSVSVRER